MKKLIVTTAMLALLATPVLATEEENSIYYVKYSATNLQEVYSQILNEEYPDGTGSISRAPNFLGADTIAYVTCGEEIKTVQIKVVFPTFETQNIPTISADSTYNQSLSDLTNYIYEYRELTQTNAEYDAAYGQAPVFELSKYSIGREYDIQGKTYNLSQVVVDQTLTQTLTVTSIANDEPEVDISSTGILSCYPETIQYSTDGKSWSSIKDGASIPTSCYGSHIYFRTPASGYATASDYVRVYVKEQQDPPTLQPVLSATSFSIKVDNASSYSSDCTFSIDGTHFSRTTEWAGLEASTKYTVYVRHKGNSSYFASPAISASISTATGGENAITYTQSSTANTTYFLAEGTTKLSVSSKTLSATYTDSTVSTLRKDIQSASKRMSAVTVLDVLMEQEEGDTREFNKVKFSMPKNMGLLQLRLSTPYCTLLIDDSSSSVEIAYISSGTNSSLSTFLSGKDVAYKVTTSGDGSIQILYPWEFPTRADLSGLRVTYADTKYKKETAVAYQVVDEGILFTIPDDGYFAITNLRRNYGALPFRDTQTHWAYSYIHYAYENGLVTGISESEFSPDMEVSRSQVVVLLARLLGADKDKTYAHPYIDVPEDSWYGWAVGYLYQLGALQVQDGYLFEPEAAITREEMAALIGKVFPYTGTIWRPMDCSDRDEIATYALTAVDNLYNLHVLMGDENGRFNPTSTLTRGEFVTILYRLQTTC